MTFGVKQPKSILRTVLFWSIIPVLGAGICHVVKYLNPPKYPPYVVPNARAFKPKSMAYETICVMDGETPAMPREVQILLIKPPSDAIEHYMLEMRVRLPSLDYMKWEYGNWKDSELSEQWDKLDTNAILAWMAIGKIDTEDEGIRTEANELMALFDSLASGADLVEESLELGSFQSGKISTTNPNRSPFQELIEKSPSLWLAIWLIGILVIRRRCTMRRLPPSWPVCSHCNYNLTGNVSGVCPECGERI